MKDSENKKNNIDEHPISTVRNGVADVENMIIGVIWSGFCLIAGLVTMLGNIPIGLGFIALSIMSISEIIRGKTSIENKNLIHQYNTNPTENLKAKMKENDQKIMKLNKIKKYCLIIFLVLVVLGIILLFI